MKVVATNVFSSSAKGDPRRALVVAVGRTLQELYGGVLHEPLPASLLVLARCIDDQAPTSG